MTRLTSPRLVTLAAAQKVLGGRHPILLGIGAALDGLYDLKAIHAALDRKANLAADDAVQGPANDDVEENELTQLGRRIAANAPRRP